VPIEHKLVRCENLSDTDRCQSTGSQGQCPYKVVPGFQYCPRHAGVSIKADEKRRASQYRLQVWQQRMNEFAESEDVKSLRDEIGILRLLMEEMMIKCEDAATLMIWSSKISDLAMKIEKLVSSCHRLEAKMGMLLDKSAALRLAGQIVDIISHEVSDPDVVDRISNGIITALASLTTQVEE
jgi:hypothetical protein